MRLILANTVMLKAYRAGIPANGQPFPDGSKIDAISWRRQGITFSRGTEKVNPYQAVVWFRKCRAQIFELVRGARATWVVTAIGNPLNFVHVRGGT